MVNVILFFIVNLKNYKSKDIEDRTYHTKVWSWPSSWGSNIGFEQLALIINTCSFITKDGNIMCCIHSFYNGCLENVMHYFSPGLINIVTLVFMWIALHLKELQQTFHAFIFKHLRLSFLEDVENCGKLNDFL